jgi:hypothetical protein
MRDAAWRQLIESFADGRIDGRAFEQRYLDMWREDRDAGESNRYAVDILFYGVDAYCADPALFGEHDITEDQLREEARQALARWDEPWPSLPPLTAEDRRDMELMDGVRRAAAGLGLPGRR